MPGDIFQINFVCVIISPDTSNANYIIRILYEINYHSRAIERIGIVRFARIENKIVIICNTIRGFLSLTFNYLAGEICERD